jgi:hypothetical protein
MGALTRIGLAAVAIAAAAVAVVLVIGRSGSVPPLEPTAPLAVQPTLDPAAVQVGDRIVARIVVELDRSAVRTGTLQVTDDLAPLTQLASATTSRDVRGKLELVTLSVPVACVTDPCVAHSGVTHLSFPRVRVRVTARDGRVETVSRPWPRLDVRARVTAADLSAAQPPFLADTSPHAVSYRISPAVLAALLDAFAALLAVGSVALIAWQALVVFQRRRPVRETGELERALRLAREAEARAPADRRRALGLLSRVLPSKTLSLAARELAWSEPAPERTTLEELVAEIERSTAP